MMYITKFYLFCLTLLCLSIVPSREALASHGMGGEITWRCLGSGEYIFQVKFYRDCNGIPGPASITISTNYPTIPNIPASLISQTDISPDGYFTDGITPCPNCPMGGSPAIAGLVEEFVYESALVVLTSPPPAGGWIFTWGECCRSNALTNITGGGSIGFQLMAKMLPFNGQNTYPCFDSSPFFAEKPNFIVCTGVPVTYQHLAGDNEFDSLVYAFDDPLDDLGSVIPYAPGYTTQQPLADPVTLDPANGSLSFTPFTGGYFALVVKVSAYKCGLPVAEIRREINMVVNNNCPNLSTGQPNLPPLIQAPFIDDNTGLQTSFVDTVIAGDTLDFTISATDYNLFANNNPQTVNLGAFGMEYGTGFTDPSSGCVIPPCATLTPAPPVASPLFASQQFNWTTTPAHLGYSFSCVQFSNTYYFLAKATDNFCPANASGTQVISITVVPAIPQPPVVNNGGTLECNLGPSYIYQWFLNRFAIPGANTFSYTPTQNGTYQVLAVAPDGQGNYSNGYVITTGLDDLPGNIHCTVSPNPSSDGIFQISIESPINFQGSIRAMDASGKEIHYGLLDLVPGIHQLTIDLSQNAHGIYMLEIISDNGSAIRIKLVR